MRLERACDSLAKNLEGPDGARIAITFAEMALDLFDDAGWAVARHRARARAPTPTSTSTCASRGSPDALARADGADESLARVVAACEKPYSNVGVALLRLVGAVASAMGDGPRSVRAFVQAAEKDPDDDETVAQGRRRRHRASGAGVRGAALEEDRRLPQERGASLRSPRRRTSRAITRAPSARSSARCEIAPYEARAEIARELTTTSQARRARRGGGPSRHRRARRLSRGARRAVDSRSRRSARSAATTKARPMRCSRPPPTIRAPRAGPPSSAPRRRAGGSTSACRPSRTSPSTSTTLQHRAPLEPSRRAEASRARGGGAWLARRRRSTPGARCSTTDPGDSEADVAIEALLVARASYDELAEHLSRRASRLVRRSDAEESAAPSSTGTARRTARRFGRSASGARRSSSSGSVASRRPRPSSSSSCARRRSHASALRWLADLYERANAPRNALPVLEELAAERDRPRRAGGDRRAARSALVADERHRRRPSRARHAARAQGPPSAAVHEARVEIARAAQDPIALGAALEDLARVSPEDARVRSEMLVEAAQAAARAGDTDTSLARAKDAARLAPDVAVDAALRARSRVPAPRRRHRRGREGDDRRARAPRWRQDARARGHRAARVPARGGRGRRHAGRRREDAARVSRRGRPAAARHARSRRARGRRGPHRGRGRLLFGDAVYGNLLGLRRPGRVALAAADAAEQRRRRRRGAALPQRGREGPRDARRGAAPARADLASSRTTSRAHAACCAVSRRRSKAARRPRCSRSSRARSSSRRCPPSGSRRIARFARPSRPRLPSSPSTSASSSVVSDRVRLRRAIRRA